MNNLYQQTLSTDNTIAATITYTDIDTFTVSDSIIPEQKQNHYTDLILFFSPLPNELAQRYSKYPDFIDAAVEFFISSDKTYTIEKVLRGLNKITIEITDMNASNYRLNPKQDLELIEFCLQYIQTHNIPDFYVCLLQSGLNQLDLYIQSVSADTDTDTDTFRPNKNRTQNLQTSISLDSSIKDTFESLSKFENIDRDELLTTMSKVTPPTIATYYTYTEFMRRTLVYILTDTDSFTSKTDILEKFDMFFEDPSGEDTIHRFSTILQDYEIEYSFVLYHHFQFFAHYDESEPYTVDWLEVADDDEDDSDFRVA